MKTISNRKSIVKEPLRSSHNVKYLFAVKSMAKGVSIDEETKGAPQVKVEMFLYSSNDTGHKKHVGIVFDNLVRHSKTDWKVMQFFMAIGNCGNGQAITPNWDKVPGATGRAMFCPETIEGKTVIKVQRYMAPEVLSA